MRSVRRLALIPPLAAAVFAVITVSALAADARSTFKSSLSFRYGSDLENSALNVANEAFDTQSKIAQRQKQIDPTVVLDSMKWIVGKTGWTHAVAPIVRLVSNAQLKTLYFGRGFEPEGIQMHSLYSREDHIVYLIDTWKSDNPFDRSLLVHELVHHLQMLNNVRTACPEEYEEQAYHLQIEWLREQGIQYPHKLLGLTELAIGGLSQCQ